MKKRRAKLMALMLSVCVCVTSLPGIAAAGTQSGSQQANTNAASPLSGSTEDDALDIQGIEDGQEPGAGNQEPGIGGAGQGTDSQNPGTDGQQPGDGIQEPGTDGQTPGAGGENPGTDGQEPGTDGQEPGADGQEPGTDGQEPGTDGQEPGVDGEDPAADGQEPGVGNPIVEETEQPLVSAVAATIIENPVWKAEKMIDGTTGYKLQKSVENGVATYFTTEIGGVKMQDGTVVYYLFNDSSFMVTGSIELTPVLYPVSEGFYYFMEAENATLLPGGTDKADPAQSNVGQMQKDYWYKVPMGTSSDIIFQYFAAEDGKKTAKPKGIYLINDTKYYLDDNGKVQKNVQVKDPADGCYYYFGADGTIVKGDLCDVNGRLYYFTNSGRRYNKANYIGRVKGKLYYFGSGAYVIDAYRGWKKLNSKWYYFASDGTAKTGWITEGGKKYWLNKNGVMATGWVKTASGNRYYFNTSGVMQTGWQKISGYYYYFTKTGYAIRDRIYNGYYFSPSAGIMMTGLRVVDGDAYYFKKSTSTARNGKMYKSTWVKVGSKYYYATASGKLATRWQKIKDKYYYLDPNTYVMWANRWGSKSGVAGYFDSTGAFCTGWVKFKSASGANTWRYAAPEQKSWVTGWKYINGYKYYFNSSGNLVQDMRSMVSGPYRLEVNRTQCVMNVYAKDASTGTYCIPVVTFLVSVGLPGMETPDGTFSVSKAGRWQSLMGPSWGQYAMHVDGAGAGGIFVHSVAGAQPNVYSLPAWEWNYLGLPKSHGCIRVCVGDAYWIWNHVSSGSSIRIYDSAAIGPFDKPAMRRLEVSQNWDPTDPAITGKW